MADPFDDPNATPFEDATKAPTVRSMGSQSETDTPPMQQKVEDFARGPLTKQLEAHQKRDQDIIAQSDKQYKDDIGEARHAYEQIKPAHFDPPPTPQTLFQNWGAAFLPLVMLAARKGSRPRIDTLNAAAGFMKGAAEGNQQQFERDFKTWQEKSKQVIEEQRALQDKYQNALKLAQTDQQAGRVAMEHEAILYQDNVALTLSRNGMNDQLAHYFESMQRINDAHEQSREKVLDWKQKQELKLEQLNEWQAQGKKPTAMEKAIAFGQIDRMGKTSGAGSPITQQRNIAINEGVEEFTKEHGRPPNSHELNSIISESFEKPMTANEKSKEQGHIDQYDNSIDKLDSALNVLDNYVGAAGIAGKGTRLAERVTNIFGSSATDRAQFMRTIEYLKLEAPRLLTDSSGRPLSAEAKRIDDIIGGLSLGDTTANTKRSLEEVKTLYAKMKEDNLRRLQGTWTPRGSDKGGAPGKSSPTESSSDAPWESAPVVK